MLYDFGYVGERDYSSEYMQFGQKDIDRSKFWGVWGDIEKNRGTWVPYENFDLYDEDWLQHLINICDRIAAEKCDPDDKYDISQNWCNV